MQRTDWQLPEDHGGNCLVKDGNKTVSGDHFVVYTDVEL